MTEQEAIEVIKANYPSENYSELREALKIAIHYLKESEPLKPYAQGDGSFACDNCGETVGEEELNCGGISMIKYKFCPECGKKVNWDD